MSVTIYDIAKNARVSVTTVSKILNHKDFDISDETRDRVLSVIKELDFTPNGLARSLATMKSHVLGLMIPDISNQYFADLAKGAESMANGLGYNIILCNTDENPKRELEYLHLLKDKGVDGIIVVPATCDKESFFNNFCCEKPFVVIDRVFTDVCKDVFQVGFDNVGGGYLAAQYLIKRGHKRIGLITGPKGNSPSDGRIAGYKAALEQAGIKIDFSIIYEGDFKCESGACGAEYLLSRGATAIFALNDLMATGVYRTVYYQGLRIPEDVSVIGYDNITISELLDPPLTTVAQPRIKMGQIAASMLVRKIKNEESGNKVIFEPKIIERKSIRAL